MHWQKNISLLPYNSFKIDVMAHYFATFEDDDELLSLITNAKTKDNTLHNKLFVLGGGSNILLTGHVDGFVLRNQIKGFSIIHEDNEYVYVKVGAGENWHSFVQYCIERNWGGVENLSLIPGHVGAAPIQNIGAYGVELKEVFYSLEAMNLADNKVQHFTRNDCAFGYRDSIFKRKYKGQFVILTVTFQLRKHPQINTSYGAIEQELDKMNIQQPTIQDVSNAVIRIRSAKLPDPKVIGNAGSFFKNPEIEEERFLQLKKEFPDIIGYPLPNGKVKLAAGWLIEQTGPAKGKSWKGYRLGDAGCHAKQALVLVNYGNASGEEIYDLSKQIEKSVDKKFSIQLEREVNII